MGFYHTAEREQSSPSLPSLKRVATAAKLSMAMSKVCRQTRHRSRGRPRARHRRWRPRPRPSP